MPYNGFVCLGGVNLINDCRTMQFVADGLGPPGIQCRECDPCCGDISAGLGFPNGYNITETPWYVDPPSPDHQASVDFAGILITNIEGLEPGNFTRPLTESAGYGAVIGQGRQSAPQVVVTGLLMAATCCAQDYGLKWLRAALKGSCGGSSTCVGDDLLFLSCEPQTPDLDCPDEEDFDFEAWLATYYRTMKGVGLIDGPHITNKIPRACANCSDCPIYEVQFTLAASKPCIYLDPTTLVSSSFDCEAEEECIIWVTDGSGCEDCPDVMDCATDPNCVSTVSPPPIPAIQNPCDNDCISSEDLCRVCVDIPPGTFPANGEGTLVITVDNTKGLVPIRRMKLRVWQNPLDLDPSSLDECNVCSELNISYLAPGASLTIDGANQISTIDCPGGQTVRANPFISSGSGSPSFQYPVMDGCAGQYTACLQAPGPISPDVLVSIQAVGREC